MQSKGRLAAGFAVAGATALAAGLIAGAWHQGEAALLLEVLVGATLGFVLPRGAWRWALILALWVPILALARVPLVPGQYPSACPPGSPPVQLAIWTLALAPFVAVLCGVVADWIFSEALRWIGFTGWRWLDRVKPAVRIAAVAGAACIIAASALMLAQPLHPYAVGESYCWDEFCFAVTQVKRVKTIGSGATAARAHGMFYVVTADMLTPWWGRFDWSNDAVYAIDYDGRDYRYSIAGQAALDAVSHSRRAQCHRILGAGESETIVFDLPDDVVQPRLLVRDTLGFDGLLGGVRSNLFYVKPAFNLRYD